MKKPHMFPTLVLLNLLPFSLLKDQEDKLANEDILVVESPGIKTVESYEQLIRYLVSTYDGTVVDYGIITNDPKIQKELGSYVIFYTVNRLGKLKKWDVRSKKGKKEFEEMKLKILYGGF